MTVFPIEQRYVSAVINAEATDTQGGFEIKIPAAAFLLEHDSWTGTRVTLNLGNSEYQIATTPSKQDRLRDLLDGYVAEDEVDDVLEGILEVLA